MHEKKKKTKSNLKSIDVEEIVANLAPYSHLSKEVQEAQKKEEKIDGTVLRDLEKELFKTLGGNPEKQKETLLNKVRSEVGKKRKSLTNEQLEKAKEIIPDLIKDKMKQDGEPGKKFKSPFEKYLT